MKASGLCFKASLGKLSVLMKSSDFHYDLPADLIAHYPTRNRVDSRLLVLNQGGVTHGQFSHLIDYLEPNDLLVLNDTKVIPARLFGVKATGGKVELLIERILDEHSALTHIKASKGLKVGDRITLEGQLIFEVIDKQEGLVSFKSIDERSMLDLLEQYGRIPLPPYIQREATLEDKERYQTVYAQHQGSVAAPTAGLHFDEDLLKRIQDKGVVIGRVTLHVGAGTFQPVRAENISDHQMHAEYIEVSQALCDQVKRAKALGGKVIAVGTTSTRCLETAARDGDIKPFSGDTSIFIYPGYEFKIVDGMVTNFHLPESTLMMLICAFAGYDEVMRAYREAVEEKYRFYSYGDATLLYRKSIDSV